MKNAMSRLRIQALPKRTRLFFVLMFALTLLLPNVMLATGGAIISNGTVQLGVHNEGHLNIPGPPSSGGTFVVGLRYVPTNAEATSPGCLCEGWGVADAISGVVGFADEATVGTFNIVPLSFTATASTAVSKVRVGNTFEVTHDYHPSVTPNLYEVLVSIKNISGAAVDLRYRRVMDWDVEPTIFNEFVTIQGFGTATNLLFTSDDGFASPNPLAPHTQILFSGNATDSGPADHGALFEFGFGLLPAGETKTFRTYYGASANESEANLALAAVSAEAFSFGQPNVQGGPTQGIPNTFIFAFSGVGGPPLGFDICIQDDVTKSFLSFNSTTGDYIFTDCGKGTVVTGRGQVVKSVNDGFCKVELFDSGPDPKRPDRSISALANPCTKRGDANVKFKVPGSPSMRTVILGDANITNNTCACP